MAKSQTFGDDLSMEPTSTTAGTSTGGVGNGAHNRAQEKGTERPCRDVSYGAAVGENVPGAPDFRTMPPVMHGAGPRDKGSNTNPGKGREIRPAAQSYGEDSMCEPRTTT